MPTEPERDIEKTLRAYAKKRQEQAGAPAELHPATRRLLLGEVARLRGGKTPEKPSFWAQWFGANWLRTGASVAALVVMAAVAAALMLPALSKSKRASTFGMAQRQLKDVESLSDSRKLALNSPQAPSDVPARPGVREERAHKVAGETQNYPAGAVPALTSPERQKTLDYDKNGSVRLAAKSVPPARDRGIVQQELVEKSLAEQSSSAPRPVTPPPPAAVASAPELDSSTTVAASSKYRLVLEPAATNSLGTLGPAPAVPPPLAATTPAASPPASFEVNGNLSNHAPPGRSAIVFANSSSFAGKPSEAATDSLGPATATTESGRRSPEDSPVMMTNFWSQRFARASSTNNLSRRQRTINRVVLRAFRVEQSGNQIRFIDSDGSVYSGFFGGAQNKKEQTEALAVTPAATEVVGRFQFNVTNSANVDGAKQVLQNLYFRVSGTNRSLRQPVVFTGNFLPAAIRRGEKPDVGNGAAYGSFAPSSGGLNWQVLDSQIQGQVLVGGSNKMEIKAAPVKR